MDNTYYINIIANIKQSKNPNSLTCREFEKSTHVSSASQPAVRPTSGGSIGPVFSHNAEY